ncbi:MAG: general secretion pathway protein GspB [Candidatus Omnitrophica bacterium]|nr:general secretion pathway protein GspB [Candidatus Omnitrophota bacterium]
MVKHGIWLCIVIMVSVTIVYASIIDERASISYDEGGHRDPFRPLIGKDIELTQVTYLKSVDDLMIEGILVDPDKGSVAIINGQVLREGNFIGGFRIDTIENNKVIFSRDDKTYTINYGDVGKANDPKAYKSMFSDVAETEF